METEQEKWDREHLQDLKDDMDDAHKSWQNAEKEIISAREWRDKMVLNYATYAVKYFNEKNKLNLTIELPPEVINELTETI